MGASYFVPHWLARIIAWPLSKLTGKDIVGFTPGPFTLWLTDVVSEELFWHENEHQWQWTFRIPLWTMCNAMGQRRSWPVRWFGYAVATARFWTEYLYYSVRYGYWNNPLEVQARASEELFT